MRLPCRSPAIGHGQILLIGKVILVLTESGELLLVEASPEKYRELASIRAFPEEQVTWNNPSFSAPYLLVRNAEQAVCYELALEEKIAEASRSVAYKNIDFSPPRFISDTDF